MKTIRILATMILLGIVCNLVAYAQYQRKRVPAERTMNDSIKVGKVYEYKLYGDIEGTRRTTIKVNLVKNDSVWYCIYGEKHVKPYKSLIKCLVLE